MNGLWPAFWRKRKNGPNSPWAHDEGGMLEKKNVGAAQGSLGARKLSLLAPMKIRKAGEMEKHVESEEKAGKIESNQASWDPSP